ncbi:hypothetical protein [Bailinhaonella thermotolerans]|uniref:Uncharacterized protein n=1 Tax=Bailinhaonella thermotolerans TaxID=1070861 RepID=A0A3A4A098_9ACTN|nr:hypothetical protein [Bailinhaonella thermotolerans]RJL21232.1 hypothetical protein D5H75_37840 [Bailinhaonella thermotolerans]
MAQPLTKDDKDKDAKEALYVRQITDEGPVFLDVTGHVGKILPPGGRRRATCAVRTRKNSTCSFSLMHITERRAKDFFAAPLNLPGRTFSRLEARAAALMESAEMTADRLIVDFEGATYAYAVDRDPTGEASLEPVGEDPTFELPAGPPSRFDMYLRSAILDRVLAVSFSGHLGKGGTPETLSRAAAKALNSLLGLWLFRELAGFAAVALPAPPTRLPLRPAVQGQVVFPVHMALFTPELQPVAEGMVQMEVDLEQVADSLNGELLYHPAPAPEFAEIFAPYADLAVRAVAQEMRQILGGEEEEKSIALNIVLGELSQQDVDRLRTAAAGVTALMMSPHQYQVPPAAAA